MPACADSQFTAGGVSTESGRRPATDSNSGESLGTENTSEDDTADEPVQVTGAYLVCTADDSLEKDRESDTGVGCAIFDSSGRKNISSLDITYSGYNDDGHDLGLVFKEVTGQYDATVSIPEDLVLKTRIRANYVEPSGPIELESRIGMKSPDAVAAPPKIPAEKIFGSDLEFHVGNGNINFSQNQDCNGRLQTIRTGDIKLIVEFEVPEGGADVSVALSDMCGLQFANNHAVFSSATGRLDAKAIPPGATSMDIPARFFARGKYTFEIHAGLRSDGKDYDDFIIGKMTFKANADVSFNEPSSKK